MRSISGFAWAVDDQMPLGEGSEHVWRRYDQTVPVAGIEVSGRVPSVIVTFGGRRVKDRQNQRVSHGIRMSTQDFWKVPYLLRGLCEVSAVEVERDGSKRFESCVSVIGGQADVSRIACSVS